jgi:Tfp pilus assembly protein PilP
MIQLSKIGLIFCLIGVLTGLTGCGNSEAPIVKPEIVHKKISESSGESVKAEPVSVTVPAIPGAMPLKPEIVRKKIDDKPESAMSTPVSPLKRISDEGARSEPKPNMPSSESRNSLPGQVAPTSAVEISYASEGKIDPFAPLLKEDPVSVLPVGKPKREKREPTTPLERVDLSQLKLTAIIRTPSGFKAMVEESTGKGYIVSVGTYVGTHSGRVTNILKDRIVVEEEVEDALGNVSNSNSELKFQKPSGEL